MAEDIADSWEELEDHNELDKRLQKLVKLSLDNEDETKRKSSNCENSQNSVKLKEEGGTRTPYQPSVRILKRESQNSSNSVKVNVPSKPIRTLEEREAAYAEARLRILGPVDNSSAPAVKNDIANDSPEEPKSLIKNSSEPDMKARVNQTPSPLTSSSSSSSLTKPSLDSIKDTCNVR